MGNRKIVHQVTKQYMKKNFSRTLVSFIGITLMVMLMTCVFVGKDTAIEYLTNVAKENYGKWHIAFYDIDKEQFEKIKEIPYINETAISENQYYTEFKQTGDENHPYLNIRRYSENAFDLMNIHVTEGRLPKNEDEIVLSEAVKKDSSNIAIGDEIEVDCFRRYIERIEEGETVFPFIEFTIKYREIKEAPVEFPIISEENELYEIIRETHKSTEFHHKFKVTGFIEPPSFENEYNVHYTAIAYMNENSIFADSFNCSAVTDTKQIQGDIRTELENLIGTENIDINNEVMIFSANSSVDNLNQIAVVAQVFFTVLIIFVSVILIYNVFNLSYDERCKYLGILASVGATAKQKRSSVYYEAFSLLMPALPIGFAIGCGVAVEGVNLLAPFAAKFTNFYSSIKIDSISVNLKITISAVLLIVALSTFTVLISSMLPARRISKIGPIESIRGNKSIYSKKVKKIHNQKSLINTSAEYMLSNGFAKNQRKKTRGIVSALAVFMIVFTVTVYGGQTVSQMVSYKLSDSGTEIKDPEKHEYMLITDSEKSDIIKGISETEGFNDVQKIYECMWIGYTEKEVYSKEYWEDLYNSISLYYPEGYSREQFEKEYYNSYYSDSTISMISVNHETFEKMLGKVNGNTNLQAENRCIVFQKGDISTENYIIEGRTASEYRYYQIENMTDLQIGENIPLTVCKYEEDELIDKNLQLTIVGFGDNNSLEDWIKISGDEMWVITEDNTASEINKFFDDSNIFITYLFFNADNTNPEILSKLEQLENLSNENSLLFMKVDESSSQSWSNIFDIMIKILMIAFAIFSSLICYLNIYNSVSGLMIARRHEFAVLRSMGMTVKQILKMCRYEMYVILLRSFLIAVPSIFILCKLINKLMIGRFGYFTVQFPVITIILITIISIFIVFFMEIKCCIRENKSDLMNEIKKDSI